MRTAKLGYYGDRNPVRLGIQRDELRSAFSRRPNHIRIETLEGFIVLTDPQMASYRHRDNDS
jgi:hypothetical protein